MQVVTDGEAAWADAGDVEDDEAVTGRRPLVRLPREALPVRRRQRTARADDDGGVVDRVAVALVDRARHQPQTGLAGKRAELIGERTGQRDRDLVGITLR